MRQEPLIPQEIWDTIPAVAQAVLLVVFGQSEQRIEQLEQRVAELEAQVNKNSTNSSKPPSSDPPSVKRAPPKNPSNKKRGGQPGHPKSTRPLLPPTNTVPCKPNTCSHCKAHLHGHDDNPDRYQVVDLPPLDPIVTEYQRHRLTCARCQHETLGSLPENVRGQDGPTLQAFVVYLLGQCRMSKRQVSELISAVFGIPLSPGQVCAIQAEMAKTLEPVVNELAEQIQQQPVNVDETSWKQGKVKSWMWVAATALFTFFLIRPKRDAAGAKELLGNNPNQVVTTDRYSSYSFLPWQRHQWCWAHLRRDFQAMIDRKNGGSLVGQKLLDASDQLFHWWHRRRDGTCSEEQYQREMAVVRGRILDALGEGLLCACAKTSATCDNLMAGEERLWTFLNHESVTPTNNAAERALRHGVCWRKTSYGTQSATGSRFVASILSVVMTCRQQNKNLWEYLRACCQAAHSQLAPPSLLPQPTNNA